ncbi:MAG: NAD(P)-dependent oxidoreductase [Candidatus Sumerlaeota bacterium]|nr:NAD(P)-dependent oxidoreductase [Candidatus Sumerlaeota bacterium]
MRLAKDHSLVAWIGTGVMGRSMAGHLQKAGWRLIVHNRTKDKADDLLRAGAQWASGAGEAAARADAVFTMVGFPHDVREVYLGQGGIVERAKPGALLVDMTTSEPTLAADIARAAEARGLRALDAPVSGGDIGAREARLSIMVGGDAEAFAAARPFFEIMGKQIVHHDGPGAGQHAKMCNQMNVAATMMGVVEALLYAKKAGLDPARMIESVGSGAASSWSLVNYGPRILRGDFNPGFYVRHFIKDMDIALAEAKKMNLPTPCLELARDLYQKVVDLGGDNLGIQALYLAMEKM